jgi:hypothetical protein
MKKIILLLLLIPLNLWANPQCELVQELDGQKHYECTFTEGNKKINFMEFHGPVDRTAYYHGLFLGPQIKDGVLAGIKNKKDQLLKDLSKKQRKSFKNISSCLMDRYQESVSDEFNSMNKYLWKGIRASGVKGISLDDIIEANLIVEMSIFFDGIEYAMELNKKKTYLKLFSLCGFKLTGSPFKILIKKVASAFKSLKFGCTGIGAPSNYTSRGDLILGRNFDTGLLTYFDKYPTVVMQHPDSGNSYVAMASAGIHYPGGISGFNKKGLTVSLHELQTFKPEARYSKENEDDFFGDDENVGSDITPYLLNRILIEADNIDEAIALTKKYKGFGAWTIFIGDSKTNEIASIEIAGRVVKVSRYVKDQALAQSNHYFHPKTLSRAFTYSLNKHYETRARYDLVTKALERDKGKIDHQWFINMLAGHNDFLVGKRSFGRTVTKAYTAMTHVMIPGRKEFWFSLAERYPATSSTFYGIQVDFNTKGRYFSFVGHTKAVNDEIKDSPNWDQSLHYYSTAYASYEKGTKEVKQVGKAIDLLGQAIHLAQQDGITEVPYHYIRARLQIRMMALSQSKSSDQLELVRNEFQMLIDKSKGLTKVKLLPYQESLIYLWIARSYDLQDRPESSREYYQKAKDIHLTLLKKHRSHRPFQQLIHSYSSGGTFKQFTWDQAKSESIRFGTVE